MSLLGEAAIAIWQDVPAEAREAYYEWHNREHVAERVGVAGFLRGRRYVALEGSPEFFTLYEATSLDVLTGPDYTARLNAPTPQTRRVAALLTNNVRSLCRVALSRGAGQGGLVLTMRYDVREGRATAQRALLERLLGTVAGEPGVASVHLCLGDESASAVQTAEKKTRPSKALTPGWVVLVEGAADAESLRRAGKLLYDDALESAGALLPIARGLYSLQYCLG
jgi:hypothetical protein